MTKKYAISNLDWLVYYLAWENEQHNYQFSRVTYLLYYLYGYYAALFGNSQEPVGGELFPKELADIPINSNKGSIRLQTIYDWEDEDRYINKPEGYDPNVLFDGLNQEQAQQVKKFVDEVRYLIKSRDLSEVAEAVYNDKYEEFAHLSLDVEIPDRSVIVKRFIERQAAGQDYATLIGAIKKIPFYCTNPIETEEERRVRNCLVFLGEDFPVKFVNNIPLAQFIAENYDNWDKYLYKLRQLVWTNDPKTLESVHISWTPDMEPNYDEAAAERMWVRIFGDDANEDTGNMRT